MRPWEPPHNYSWPSHMPTRCWDHSQKPLLHLSDPPVQRVVQLPFLRCIWIYFYSKSRHCILAIPAYNKKKYGLYDFTHFDSILLPDYMYQIKSLTSPFLTKCVFLETSISATFRFQIKQMWLIFTHLKWVVVVRQLQVGENLNFIM